MMKSLCIFFLTKGMNWIKRAVKEAKMGKKI